MKRFGKFRDPRFALTTLQNPTWEVRTRAELIQAAQPAIERQPDAAVATPGNANPLIGVSGQQPQSDPEPEPQFQPQSHPIAATPPDQDPATHPLPQVVATLPAKRNRKYKPRPKRRPQSGSFFKLIPGGDAALARYVSTSFAARISASPPNSSSNMPIRPNPTQTSSSAPSMPAPASPLSASGLSRSGASS
jgi:hypothetical protein